MASAPESASLSGKVVDEAGQPIVAAQVTIDLINGNPHPSPSIASPWQHRWEVTTDAQGRYVIQAVPLLDDPYWLWFLVRVSAEGFVDHEPPALSLKNLLGVSHTVAQIADLRLLRGVIVHGRVLGGDGKPVPGASLLASGATSKGAKEPGASDGRIQHRLRRTDKEGSFEFSAHPRMGIDLVIQCDGWAPKRIFIPAQQTNAGDIRLERGTTVTGTLKNENDVPLPGYWILAESHDLGLFPSALNPIKLTAKTDAVGCFTLSPLKGRFKIRVADNAQVWWTEPQVQSPSPKVAILPQDYNYEGNDDRSEIHLRAAPQVRVSGQILSIDGQPAKREPIEIYCNAKTPERQVTLDSAWTDEQGRYAFQGIPRAVKEVFIGSGRVYPWKTGTKVYLKMCPSSGVSGARKDGMVYLDELTQNVTNIDFRFCFWKDGQFLEEAPDRTEEPSANRKHTEETQQKTQVQNSSRVMLTPEETVDWLQLEYERKLREFFEKTPSDRVSQTTLRTNQPPMLEYAHRYLALAEAYPRTDAAFRALDWICQICQNVRQYMPSRPSSEPVHGESNLLQITLTRLQSDHLHNTNFTGQTLQRIAELGGAEAERLLRQLAETNPRREVRGQALYYLGKQLARAAEEKPSIGGEQQIVTLYQRVTNDFANLPHWRGTLGEAATHDLYEIQHLGVGNLAPEIIGPDAYGVEFKLSDHRGNIVVLIFSGEWCAPCRAQQPRLRALQEIFRDKSVRFLAVMSDSAERLREATRSGNITWRCWCDGNSSGPIVTQWNITSRPTMHLLDQHGVIRHRNVSVDQLQRILETLLQEQEQAPTRSSEASSLRR